MTKAEVKELPISKIVIPIALKLLLPALKNNNNKLIDNKITKYIKIYFTNILKTIKIKYKKD